MRYAKHTSVSAEKSRLEIEQAVKRYGADQFGFAQATDRAMIQFRLIKPRPLMVRFRLPLTREGSDGKRYPLQNEQLIRQRWRALLLCIKAKLESVETGIESVEHAFLAEVVMPDGRTMGEWAEPQLRTMIEDGQMPRGLLEFNGC